MRQILFIFIVLFITQFLFTAQTQTKEPDWMIKLRKIELLKSKRADVESIFGNPKIIRGVVGELNWRQRVEYETEDGELEVHYSTGRCLETNYASNYDIERGVVIEVRFEPNEDKTVSLKDLNFDYSKFDADRIPIDVVDAITADNKETGVEIYSIGEEFRSIGFRVPPKFRRLDCEEIKERLQEKDTDKN